MRETNHAVSGTCVFLLLGLFAVFSMLLVLLGAQAYRATVDATAEHGDRRVLQNYVRNAVRAADENGAFSVSELEGLCVLALSTPDDADERYVQYIYCYQGALRELYTSAEYGFAPEDGDPICPALGLEAQLQNGLLTVVITDAEGERITVRIAPRAAGEEAQYGQT